MGHRLEKIIHRAGQVSQVGDVSAVCYKRPRPIRLALETWTIVDNQVTCEKCLRAMLERPRITGREDACPE